MRILRLVLLPVLLALVSCSGSKDSEVGAAPPLAALGQELIIAAGSGYPEAVKRLLDAGADPNATEPMVGSSALFSAAVTGQSQIIRLLVASGAMLDYQNKEGSTALLTASFFGKTEAVKTFLELGADPNLKNRSGSTALDTVGGEFSPELQGLYLALCGMIQIEPDVEAVTLARPKIAELLRANKGKLGSEL